MESNGTRRLCCRVSWQIWAGKESSVTPFLICCLLWKEWLTHPTERCCHGQVCSSWRRSHSGQVAPPSCTSATGGGELATGPVCSQALVEGPFISSCRRPPGVNRAIFFPGAFSSLFVFLSLSIGHSLGSCWTVGSMGQAKAEFISGGGKTVSQRKGRIAGLTVAHLNENQTLPNARISWEPDSFLLCWAQPHSCPALALCSFYSSELLKNRALD